MKKIPLRARLSFSHMLVLFTGMILAGFLVWVSVESLYLSTQRENLLFQAELTAGILEESPGEEHAPEPYSQTANVSPGIHTRLLSQSGAVVIGIPFPQGEDPVPVPPAPDPGFVSASELIERTEIQAALKGQGKTAVRRIEVLDNQRVLYAAAPVFNSAGEVVSLVYMATPLPSQGLPPRSTLELIGALLAGLLVAGVSGILLANNIARPLENLSQAASRVSQGDLDQMVPPNQRISEIDTLASSFNQMTSSLKQSNELKNAFIADITHELRTPLTVIKGTVETLEGGALDDQVGRVKLLEGLKSETERLIKLVNQLLLLARSDAGALSLNISNLELDKLVRERTSYLTPLADKKGVRILVHSPLPESCQVQADRDRTAQVIDNLLDNALRFAPSGSEILIGILSGNEQITCSVQDAGPGIREQDQPRIFDRFYRVEAARDRGSGGSGLGLAIARALVEAQGGEIQVQSQEQQGTLFSFSLPIPKLPDN